MFDILIILLKNIVKNIAPNYLNERVANVNLYRNLLWPYLLVISYTIPG